jgi:hypothetical protein
MLKYLFVVKYKDGSIYQQNSEDISITDSKRSCYFDVVQDKVEEFHLCDTNNVYSVFLNDGHFEINRVPFFMHDTGEGLKDFRLIFYRQHEQSFNIGTKQQLSHEIKYCMGWQTNLEGKNHKRIIEFL